MAPHNLAPAPWPTTIEVKGLNYHKHQRSPLCQNMVKNGFLQGISTTTGMPKQENLPIFILW